MAEIKPTINGAVIFNAGYQGGRKLPTVSKLQQLGSQGMKSIERPKPEYENLFNNSSIGKGNEKTAEQFSHFLSL